MYVDGSRTHEASRRGWLSGGYKRLALVAAGVLVVAAVGFGAYKMFASTPPEHRAAAAALQFDPSVTRAEQQTIGTKVGRLQGYKGPATVRVDTSLTASNTADVLAAYVPVTNVYDVRQQVTKAELSDLKLYVQAGLDQAVRLPLAAALNVSVAKLVDLGSDIPDGAVEFMPADKLTPQVKLLTFEGNYYLDSFDKGAVFREVAFSGAGADSLKSLKLNDYATKDNTLKVDMTGVTALTRTMQTMLPKVGNNGAYFADKIGSFLSDADITHVSNEVSFRSGCPYAIDSFCSPPQMIDALKASGVDLVELTGNHNNDNGNQYNTETINLYHSLGWHTFGGGLNATEGAKPYLADVKGSKVAFLGYNAADGPFSGAVATDEIAGANHFDASKAAADIAAAKKEADFVIVDIQYFECQAYPNGFVEYPQCDLPIGNQVSDFRQLIDDGADMVIGTQAHQPQTYELYKGKPIYYGLGNLFFEQTQWPGTERGIILTHYFVDGKLVQTRLTPTVYDKALQTRVDTADEAKYLLERLKTARTTAGL